MKHAFLLILFCYTIQAAQYYVGKDGSDSNAGTTTGAKFLTVGKAVAGARAGDNIKVFAGAYNEKIRFADFAGSSGSPITLDGQTNTSVLLDSITWEQPWINCLNLFVTNASVFNNSMLYVAQNGSHCILSNCIFDAAFDTARTPVIRWNGPDAYPFGVAGSFNLIISNEFRHPAAEMLFRVNGDTNSFIGNYIHDLDFTDIWQIFGRGHVIIGNVCSNGFCSGRVSNHADLVQTFGDAGGSQPGSKWHMVASNIFCNFTGTNIGGVGSWYQIGNFTDDSNTNCFDITFKQNLFYKIAAKGSVAFPQMKWYNNVFYQCADNPDNGGHILNATDVGSIGHGHSFDFRGNVVLNCGLGTTNDGDVTVDVTLTNCVKDYNYFGKLGYKPMVVDGAHRPVGNGSGWDPFAWWEDHGINGGIPHFVAEQLGDFHLMASSPLIDAGVSISGIGNDIEGTAIPQGSAPDIGLYEYVPYPAMQCWVDYRTIRAYPVVNTNTVSFFWPPNALRTQMKAYFRIETNKPTAYNNWTPIYTNNAATITNNGSFTAAITNGLPYEFQLEQLITNYVCADLPNYGFRSFEYVSTGMNLPLRDTNRGNLILLVETNAAVSLSASGDLATLKNDIIGEGFKLFLNTNIVASEVDAANWKTNVTGVKSVITSFFNTDTNADWYLFFLGHVPVPYSGDNSPGSHTNNLGAHPADSYYGDMFNTWTDSTVNDVTGEFAAQHNTPGDGKFDQSAIPGKPTMRIGRVDLKNMPAYGLTEVQLLQRYLRRNHAWRTKQVQVPDRTIVYSDGTNNVGGTLSSDKPIETHDISAAFFGGRGMTDTNWLPFVNTGAYLFGGHSGSGHYDGSVQMGDTVNFATNNLNIVFPSLYGSYYGDWDSAIITNSFIQMPLANAGLAVATFYHANTTAETMEALDEPIGNILYAKGANYDLRFGSNGYTDYGRVVPGVGETTVIEQQEPYVTMLGDPTLRVRIVAPVSNLTLTTNGTDNILTWGSAVDWNVTGYHVYRASNSDLNTVTRLTSSPTALNSYTNSGAGSGFTYWVRTVQNRYAEGRSLAIASTGALVSDASGGGGGGGGGATVANAAAAGKVAFSGGVTVK